MISCQGVKNILGTNENKKKDGDFPLDSLYILPTLSKPSQNVIVSGHFDTNPF